jgi:pantetheine-phosphate adenylyltransferase
MREAIYAVSGDPWTKGHTNIVERALQIFDRVIIGIGINPKKKYSFSTEMRVKLAKISLEHLKDRVEVVSFEGLLVDFAFMRGVKILIRGIRDDIDFNFERSMFQVNITQRGIDEIFLFPDPEFEHISSSAVRELQQNQGNIIDYVDLRVKQAMEVQLSNQRLIGITGVVGAGKTYMANKLCEIGKKITLMDFHNVELDAIGRKLLMDDTRPFAKNMRFLLIEKFFPEMHSYNQGDFIDVKEMSKKIFSDKSALKAYNKISEKPILFELQQQLRGKTGVIFLNSALLIEANLTPLCNNNVLFITAEDNFRLEKLKSRGYTGADLEGRMNGQLSGTLKHSKFQALLEKDQGHLLELQNSATLEDRDLCALISKILQVTESM